MTLESDAAISQATEDQQLLARVSKQDRRAFETLYRRYYRRVFYFVFRLVRNEQAAEEIVGDVMFAVWQSAASFEGASRVSTWLLGIAYRQAMKAMDKNRKHALVDSNDELLAETLDDDPAANPESAAMTDSYAALLQRAVAALAEHHRVVVQLTAMDYSYGEISEILGCCENTVKTRMFHARRQLKRYLDNFECDAAAAYSVSRQPTFDVVSSEPASDAAFRSSLR